VISIVPPALASAQSSTLDGRVVGVPLSDPLLGRLEEFQAVPERIVGVDTSEAWEVGVPGHRLSSGVEAGGQAVEVIDEHAGMSFTSRPELMLDPEVQFDAAVAKPRPAARCEGRWLGDLRHADHADVKAARGFLLTSRHCQLDVVQTIEHVGKSDASCSWALAPLAARCGISL
jgi:hypothetical protein